jgi:major membrane immunogen (membrane-anchored lipoprotein)
MKKIILTLAIMVILTGCAFFTGTKKTTTDPLTGEQVVTYEDAPIEAWADALKIILPGGAIAIGAAARMARNAARARDGMMDANKEAIENADWKKINSKESFKQLLALGQASHKDAKLLEKEYKKWKKKKA